MLFRSWQHIPIVMVSADASEGLQDPLYTPSSKPAHDAYIVKPLRFDLLLNNIGNLLQLKWNYASITDLHRDQSNLIAHIDVPEEKHLEDLVRLASIGHKKGLLNKLQKMESDASAAPQFISEMRTMINTFQFEKIMDYIHALASEQQAPRQANESAI